MSAASGGPQSPRLQANTPQGTPGAKQAKHAVLGASSAERWLNCPPSVALTQDMPDTTSPYAREGTIAHELGELKLRKHFLTGIGPKRYASMSRDIKGHLAAFLSQTAGPSVTQEAFDAELETAWAEMEHCTDTYLDTAKEIALGFPKAPYVALEQRVDFSAWVPEGFGTADCIMIGSGILHIIDYKHGRGVAVPAENNPQLMLYALGAWQRYQALYPIHTLRWTIVQPRNGGVSAPQEISTLDLLKWAQDVVAPRAQLAYEGQGEYSPGEWCRWCKAKATCRARSDYNLALEGFTKTEPALLSAEEIGAILIRSRDLAKWVSDLEAHALTALLDGQEIPGWKAVAGRALRIWTDQEAAFAKAQELGTPEAMLYERRPVSLAQLEKLMGKKAFEPLTTYVTVPPGKPTLAPDSDKRAAITNRSAAEDDFKTT